MAEKGKWLFLVMLYVTHFDNIFNWNDTTQPKGCATQHTAGFYLNFHLVHWTLCVSF